MNEYVIELNQDEVEALYLVVGSIAGGKSKKSLRFITSNIWYFLYSICNKISLSYANGIIWSTNRRFIS